MDSQVFEFGAFRVNAAERRFRRNGEEIALAPKVFEVLVFLLRNPCRLVTYDELMNAVWPDTAVEEGNLRFCIHALRKELGSDTIETVPKHGYRLKLPVTQIEEGGDDLKSAQPPATPTIASGHYPRFLIAAGLVSAVVLLAVVVLNWTGRRDDQNAYLRSLAIAPFEVASSDQASSAAIQSGLGDAIGFDLKRIRRLQVVEVNGKATGSDPIEVGKRLGVDAVLSGTVRDDNGSFKVNFEVIDVASGIREIADSVLVDRSQVTDVERAVALRIARRIDVSLMTVRDERLIPPGILSEEAKQSFLLAQRLPRENDLNRWPESVSLMKKVVAAAPEWALGHAKLAEALMLVEGSNSCDEARSTALRAIELDPSASAEAYLVLGACDIERRNWKSAEENLRTAVATQPDNSSAHIELGLLLDFQRRFAEGETYIRNGLELEPFVPYYNIIACQHYYYDKKWTEAIRYCDLAEQIEPGHFLANKRLYWVYVMQNRWDKVRELTFGRRSEEENLRDPLSRPLVLGDVRGFWEANLQDRLANKGKRPSPTAIASYYSMLGDAEKTLSLLEQAVAEKSDQVKFLYADPIWDSVRREPRYRQLIREVGLSISADPEGPTRTDQ
jgi:DNA-binding winged helix-turn-helix (wHTH) protein/TolB-like protein/tetratricopeptide (TPR) repeat protein